MPKASKAAKEFVTKVAIAFTIAGGSASGSYLQDKGTKTQKISGTAIEFVAAQLDVAASLVEASAKKGKLSPNALIGPLAQKGLAFSDFVPDDTAQCAGALVSLGVSIGTFAASTTTVAGAIPAGALLLSEFYGAHVDCKATVKKGTNAFIRLVGSFHRELYNKLNVPGGF